MGIFDRFPYSSTHEMNLDFMLGKATEIAESLQEIDTHKDQAEQAATNAAQSATNAAQAAQAAAASQTAASASAAAADQHKTDAEDAADRAEAAFNLADEAVEQAQAAAQNASTAADGAIASANAAENRINALAESLPADFTEVNNEITGLNTAFNNLNGYSLITPNSAPENYRLKTDGNAGSNTQYKLLKYAVTPGQKLYINVNLGGIETDDRALQFQDRELVSATGNTSHVVGTPIDTSYNGFVTVPAGATWLVLSVLKTDATSCVNVYSEYSEIQSNALIGATAANAIVRAPDSISAGWYILDTGRCRVDANMRLRKYSVVPGETVYINAKKIAGFNVVYQWQNAVETPSIYSENPITRIGDPVLVDTLSAVVVPEGVTWIVFNDTINGNNGLMGVQKPDVYADKIAAARVNHIKKTDNENYGNCDMSAMVVTDLHNQADRTRVIANLVNKMGNLVDIWINCGDTVYNINSEDLSWYNTLMSNLSVPNLNVIGNHDAYVTNGAYGEKSVAYQNIIAPLTGQTGIVQPTGAAENNLCYYYYDVNTVRIIGLDYVYWDANETSWLESVLADALTNTLAVVCVSHCGFSGQVSEHIKSVWREVDIPTSGAINIAAAEKVSSFIQDGGEFVCWLVGHTHGDNLHKLPNYQNQMVVTFASPVQRAAYLQKSDVATDYNYTIGTYMCVDRYYKTVKFLRIGADIDEWGIKHNGVAFNYETKTLIAAW